MNKHSCDKQQLKLLTNKRVYIYYRNLGRIRKSKERSKLRDKRSSKRKRKSSSKLNREECPLCNKNVQSPTTQPKEEIKLQEDRQR